MAGFKVSPSGAHQKMGKPTASQRRARAGAVNLYGSDLSRGAIATTTLDMVQEKVASGAWREVFFESTGASAGYQIVPRAERAKPKPPLERALTITLTETLRYCGLYGKSHTMGLPEWKRLKRHAKDDDQKILPPEDATERAIVKVKLWPFPASRIDDGTGKPVYGDRAIRVYPHTK